jgi:hypothetical protein
LPISALNWNQLNEVREAAAKLIAVAAAVIGVGAAITLGLYFWTSKPGGAQAPAVGAMGRTPRAIRPGARLKEWLECSPNSSD